MNIVWTRRALRSLDSECEFSGAKSPEAARRAARRSRAAVARLAETPWKGRPGRVPGTRELVVRGTPYIVPYRVRDEDVEVLHVLHGARKWPKAL